MNDTKRLLIVAGAVFVVAFGVGLALLGPEVGAFGDSDAAFVEHFSTGSQRAADIAGSALLAGAAVAFMVFAHVIASAGADAGDDRPARPTLVRTAGMLAGAFMIVAALALVTVPLSISMGEFFDEEGKAFREGQAVLPQFGYVVLVFGAMIPAAVTVVAVARLGCLRPWLTRASFPIAVLLAVTAGSVITMALLPIWVATATVSMARS
ncbi:MAG: hypothetical protein ACR2PK_19095 [Acidimicrobiales bacterium]